MILIVILFIFLVILQAKISPNKYIYEFELSETGVEIIFFKLIRKTIFPYIDISSIEKRDGLRSWINTSVYYGNRVFRPAILIRRNRLLPIIPPFFISSSIIITPEDRDLFFEQLKNKIDSAHEHLLAESR